MSVQLKIKAKHLALEPAIIRKEEDRLQRRLDWMKNDIVAGELTKEYWTLFYLKNSLESHRKCDVRNEARATHLARAYISGKKYSQAEAKCRDLDNRNLYITPRVVAMVKKYHDRKITTEDIMEWYET